MADPQVVDPADVDPSSIVPPQPAEPSGGAASQVVAPDDVDPTSIQPPPPAQPPASASADSAAPIVSDADVDPSTIQPPAAPSGAASPGNDAVTLDEIQEIARKHGTDPEFLYNAVPILGGRVAGDSAGLNAARSAAGVADVAGGGVPEAALKGYAKWGPGGDDKRFAAVEELDDLISSRRATAETLARGAGKLAVQIGGAGGVGALAEGAAGAAELGSAATSAAKFGAEAGLFGSQAAAEARPGDELRDVAVSTGLLAGFSVAGKLYTSASKRAAEWLVDSESGRNAVGQAEEMLRQNQNAETALQKAVASNISDVGQFMENTTQEERTEIARLSRRAAGADSGDALAEARDISPPRPTVDDVDRVVSGDAPETSGVPAVTADSPATQAVSVELRLPDVDPEAQSAFNYVQETRGKLLNQIRASDLDSAMQGQHEDFVADQFLKLRRSEYVLQSIRDAGLDMSTAAGRSLGQIGLARRAAMFISDSRHVYDAIDNRYGTQTVQLLDNISRAYNANTLAVAEATEKLGPIIKRWADLADEQLSSGERFGDVAWDAMNRGHFDPARFSEEQRGVLRDFADYFHWYGDELESAHVKFPGLGLTPVTVARNVAGPEASYVPHYVVGAEDFVARMRAELQDGGYRSGYELFQSASTGDARATELLHGLEVWRGGDITTAKDATDALAKMYALQREGEALNTSARSLFARTGFVPDFLLEKDLGKLAVNYTQNMTRHIFLRGPLGELAAYGRVLGEVSPTIGKYITDHVKDIAGVRRGTLATAMSDLKSKFTVAMIEAADRAPEGSAKRGFFQLMSHLDDMCNAAMGNMYAYYLGLRPDAAMKYMAQPFFTALPQLGADPHNIARIADAYRGAMADMARPGALREMLTRAGRLPAETAFEADHALGSALLDGGAGKLLRKVSGGAQAVNHFSMGFFRAGDLAGRAVSARLADGLVADLRAYTEAGPGVSGLAKLRGESAAKAVMNTSPGYRFSIQRAVQSGDWDAARDQLTSFLTSHTQYDYNKIAMSEFGRSMGGLFAMFSKWPTAILGETLGMADAAAIGKPLPGSGARVLTKYLAPLAAAYWLDDHIWQPFMQEKSGASYAARALVGGKLSQWVPGDTLADVLRSGPVHAPPGFDLAKSAAGGLTAGDPSAPLAAALDLSVSGMPFGVLLRRVMLEWGREVAGDDPVYLRHDAEQAIREDAVNPVRWAMGLDSATGGEPGH